MTLRRKKPRGFTAMAEAMKARSTNLDEWPDDVREYVEARTFDEATLRASHVTFAGNDEAKKQTGYAKRGLIWPYHDFNTGKVTAHRLLKPIPAGSAKYLNPRGTSQIYFASTHAIDKTWPEIAADTNISICIPESPVKAARMAQEGLPSLAGNGVSGLGGKKNGFKKELKLITWAGRQALLIPDSDWKTNPDVRQATMRNADYLASLKADVHILQLPTLPGQEKTGIDDYLSHKEGGIARFRKITPLPMDDQEFSTWRVHPEIAALNQNHAVVTLTSKVRIMIEPDDVQSPQSMYQFLPQTDFTLKHKNRFIKVGQTKKGEDIMKPLPAIWLSNVNRREYARVGFFPNDDAPPNTYNYWRGFPFEPKPGDWSLFQAHILDNIANGNRKHFAWIMNWLAHRVQYRSENVETVIVLRSPEEGTGKTKFATVFGRLFGKHFISANKADDVTGNFNARLEYCMLLFADEAFFSGDHKNSDILKSMITEKYTRIEPKNVDPYDVLNIRGTIMASNNDHVVRAGLNARRFAVFNVNPQHQKDYPYFKAIDAQMENGGYAAMLYDLLEYDVDPVATRQAPNTLALAEQKDASLSNAQRFILKKLTDGMIHHWVADKSGRKTIWTLNSVWPSDTEIVIDRERLRAEFYEYLEMMKAGRHEFSAHGDIIAKALRQIFGTLEFRKYGEPVKGVQKRGDVIPSLHDSQARFEKITSIRRNWATGEPRRRQR